MLINTTVVLESQNACFAGIWSYFGFWSAGLKGKSGYPGAKVALAPGYPGTMVTLPAL